MTYNFFDVVVLLGSIQGFVSSALLFYRSKQNPRNKYLGWILVLLSLACLNIYLLETLESDSITMWILAYSIPLVVIMPIGPLLLLYTKSFFQASPSLKKRHYSPVLLDVLPNILAILYFIGLALGATTQAQFGMLDNFTDHYNKYVDIPRWISLSIYSWMALQFLRRNKLKNIRWPNQLVTSFLVFQVIWLLHLIPYLTPLSGALLNTLSWYPVYIPLVILIYWLGLNGLLRSRDVTSIESPQTIENARKKLELAMESDKLYKNAELRLEHLVEHTGLPQKTISSVLNRSMNKSFNEFVNGYRVSEVKERLADPANDYLTITGIALESGFNSQATFQRTFKSMEKESPKEYRARFKKEDFSNLDLDGIRNSK